MSKPREYMWVGQFISRDVAYSIIDPHPDFVDKTYLVEKSAYDGVLQELEAWKTKCQHMGEVHDSQRFMIASAVQERDECKAAFEIAKQQMVLALEGKVALAAQLAEANATIKHDVDKIEAQYAQRIERLEAQLAECERNYADAASGACDLPITKGLRLAENRLAARDVRIERLERALHYAKDFIRKYLAPESSAGGALKQIDKLERGE